MKYCLLLVLYLFTSISFSQSTENYFPLAIGNKWVYNQLRYDASGIHGRYIIEVVADTLVDGNKFFILVAKNEKIKESFKGTDYLTDFRRFYIRFDTGLNRFTGYTTNNLFYTALNLNMIVGVQAIQSMFGLNTGRIAGLSSTSTKTIFGSSVNSKYLEYNSVYSDYEKISYSEGIGMDSIVYNDFYYILKGMVKDNIVYGDTSTTFTNPLSYYPLAVGNKWFYQYGSCSGYVFQDCDDGTEIWYIEKDTTLNNKKYFKFYQNRWDPVYQRIDSANNLVYQWDEYNQFETDEFIVFDLNMDFNKRHDQIPMRTNQVEFVELMKYDNGKKFNKNVFYKNYFASSLFWRNFSLVEGVGIDSMQAGFDFGSSSYYLVGMVKDGIAYGDTVIKYDKFYPLAIGNRWYYDVSSCSGTMDCNNTKEEWFIDKDTIINGKTYFVFNQYNRIAYQRVDDLDQLIYEYIPSENKEIVIFEVKLYITTARYGVPFLSDNSTRVQVDYHSVASKFDTSIKCNKYELFETGWKSMVLLNGFGLDSLLFSDGGGSIRKVLTGFKTTQESFGNTVDVNDEVKQLPSEYSLSQNYPNPFNPTTSISYSLPQSGLVKLSVFDVLGNEVAQLVNDHKSAGNYKVNFNASNFSSGIYLYKISVNNFTTTNKMILVK